MAAAVAPCSFHFHCACCPFRKDLFLRKDAPESSLRDSESPSCRPWIRKVRIRPEKGPRSCSCMIHMSPMLLADWPCSVLRILLAIIHNLGRFEKCVPGLVDCRRRQGWWYRSHLMVCTHRVHSDIHCLDRDRRKQGFLGTIPMYRWERPSWSCRQSLVEPWFVWLLSIRSAQCNFQRILLVAWSWFKPGSVPRIWSELQA